MRESSAAKSSFSLPPAEVKMVGLLKKVLHLPSNTAVVRLALKGLQKKVEREHLRQQFQTASELVRKTSRQEMEELDLLAGEGLDEV